MTRLTRAELARDIEGFLTFKRALGYSYRRGEATLRSFQRFAQHCPGSARAPIELETAARAWLFRIVDRKPVTLATDLGALRQLCLYRRRRDPNGFVPDHAWAPCTESTYQPYLFSRQEIRALLKAAARHRGRNMWPGMLRMLLLVLYCTGLRFGEAVRLRMGDVDLSRCVLTVRESKGRSRLVPFRPDLARELSGYLRERALLVRRERRQPQLDALFIRLNGQAVSIKAASEAVRRLLRRLGMKCAKGRAGPRPYDLRHAFAVHRLTDWYRSGANVHARLPWLSAYMGHVNLLGTEFTCTPLQSCCDSQAIGLRLASAPRGHRDDARRLPNPVRVG
jgi:integrase